jgi:hypothetical protein
MAWKRGSVGVAEYLRLEDDEEWRNEAWKTSTKVGALRRGSGGMIAKTTRNFDMVLVAPLVSRLLQKVVCMAFERQEKVGVRGRKGGGWVADNDGGGTTDTRTV